MGGVPRRLWPGSVLVLALVFAGVSFPGGDGFALCGEGHGPPPDPVPAGPGSYQPGLTEFLEAQANALPDRFAGSRVAADGSAVVGLTEGPVPPALAAHPSVRVETRRFSAARLDAALETAVTRLNPLLNPDVAPGTPGKWPWEGWVDLRRNVVFLKLDTGRLHQCPAVERALADEIDEGTVRLYVGAVEYVSRGSA